MVIPNSIEGSGSKCFWKLRKALYGLKQAGRQCIILWLTLASLEPSQIIVFTLSNMKAKLFY